MSNDSTGRTPRSTGNNAPMGSTVAIVVTAVAVILGFLILHKVNNNDTSGNGGTGQSGTSAPDTTLPDSNTTLPVATTIAPVLNKKATKVQVANASKISGVAKQLSTALTAAGFDTATATNATNANASTATKVIYNQSSADALPVANAVAMALGGVPVEPASNPPPVKDGAFAAGSAVIVLLGTDLAGKPLADPNLTGSTTPTGITAVPTTTG